MESENNDIEIYKFPRSMEYREYYFAFCKVFCLGEKRERITELKDGIVIEIRNKEAGHNIPHIHAHYQGDNISISLIDGKVLAGNIPKKNQKAAVLWVMENMEELRKRWENKHGIIIFPDMNARIPDSYL